MSGVVTCYRCGTIFSADAAATATRDYGANRRVCTDAVACARRRRIWLSLPGRKRP